MTIVEFFSKSNEDKHPRCAIYKNLSYLKTIVDMVENYNVNIARNLDSGEELL